MNLLSFDDHLAERHQLVALPLAPHLSHVAPDGEIQ